MNQFMKLFSVSLEGKRTMLFVVIILSSALLFSACGLFKSIFHGKSEAEKELEYAIKRCETDPMVGERKGIRAELLAKRQKLDSAKVSFSFEKYKELSQKLEGYNAAWEILNRDLEIACRDFAICDYRNSKNQLPDACKVDRDTKTERENAAREFFKTTKSYEIESSSESEKVKYEANQQLNEISEALSEYIFAAELVIEAYDKNLTTLPKLVEIVREKYNPAVSKLRRREYVYIAWLESIELSSQFQEIMVAVKKADEQLHQFNPQAEKIESGEQVKADTTFTAPIVRKAYPIFNELKSESDEFRLKLSKMIRK